MLVKNWSHVIPKELPATGGDRLDNLKNKKKWVLAGTLESDIYGYCCVIGGYEF